MSIKAILKRILPKFVIELWHLFHEWEEKWIVALNWKRRCKRKIAAIKDKEVLTVLFLPANLGMWKYDSLFRKMMGHPRFRPLILLSPNTSINEGEQRKEIETMTKYFEEKGFPVVDKPNGINPDLVFITQGYNTFTYGLKDFPKALGCYAPYDAFPNRFDARVDLLELNRVWRIFTQNKASYEGSVGAMTNKGVNVRITGYTNADYYLQKNTPFSFPWKSKNPALKKVIYATRWTLYTGVFPSFGETMLELAEKYADKIQWCFKPHPWLFRELEKLWGEKRARAYFKRWEELENGMCHEGEYISLFMTSDALIHDSGSFRCEYFYTGKPVMFLPPKEQSGRDNDVILQALDAHYQGRSREDIEKFLEEVVLGGNDPKADERESFLKEYLLPPNNQSVAQNIIDEIERGLGWRK